jgi:hypothetical protein
LSRVRAAIEFCWPNLRKPTSLKKKRDEFWGVLYADDFLAADGIVNPHARILYLDETNWRSRRTDEQQRWELDLPPPPSECL